MEEYFGGSGKPGKLRVLLWGIGGAGWFYLVTEQQGKKS